MAKSTHSIIIGRAEKISLPEHGIELVPAKIDTGAWRTSIWASESVEEDGVLKYKLFGEGSDFYTGEVIETEDFQTVSVENSFGHAEERYVVPMKIKLGTKTVTTQVTLADRSKKWYPVLVGRKLLRNKYMVDVSLGDPLEKDYED